MRNIVATVVVLAGCAPIPPSLAPTRAAVPVRSTFGKAWEAAVDVFADRNIPIRTLDRSSGLIIGEPYGVPNLASKSGGAEPHPLADCGKTSFDIYLSPAVAFYNVRVRGDSIGASTVLVTIRYQHTYPGTAIAPVECSSRGVTEAEIEKAIVDRVEGARPAPALPPAAARPPGTRRTS